MYIDFQQNRVCRSVKTVHTRLTSTLIKSVKCYKNDYHEKVKKYNTCITISTIITCTQCTSI